MGASARCGGCRLLAPEGRDVVGSVWVHGRFWSSKPFDGAGDAGHRKKYDLENRGERTKAPLEQTKASMERTKELQRLIRAGHHDLAWYQFNYMMQMKLVDTHQCAVMIGLLTDSKKMKLFMDGYMESESIAPCYRVYGRLVDQYMLEGEDAEVLAIIEKLRKDGVRSVPGQKFALTMTDGDRSRLRAERLQRLYAYGREAEAWSFFSTLRAKKLATAAHYNVMLRACPDSKETMKMMGEMLEDGLELDLRAHSMYTTKLIIEGDMAKVREYVDSALFPRASADEKLKHIVETAIGENRAPVEHSKRRTAELQRLRRGHRPLDAWVLFCTMQQNGVANKRHHDVMVGTLSSSEEMEAFIQGMQDSGMDPDVYTYVPFLYQLVVEGYEDEASRIVHEEMANHGIEPNELCYSYLELSPYRQTRMRLGKLKTYVKAKNYDAAWHLHDLLETNGVLDPVHSKYMNKFLLKSAYGDVVDPHATRKRVKGDGGASEARSGAMKGQDLNVPHYSWGGALVLPFLK